MLRSEVKPVTIKKIFNTSKAVRSKVVIPSGFTLTTLRFFVMQELIKVMLNQNNQQVVSARELHHFLGFSKTQVSRWIKSHILRNQYFEENVDYVRLDTDVEGVYDYALTLDMSKKLCMVSASKKGDEIRDYFIECEKQLKSKLVPQSYAQALLKAGEMLVDYPNK